MIYTVDYTSFTRIIIRVLTYAWRWRRLGSRARYCSVIGRRQNSGSATVPRAGLLAGTRLPPAVAALRRTGSQLIHHRWSLTTTPIISRGHPRGDGRVFRGLLGYKSLENFGCTVTWQRGNCSFRQCWWDRAVWLQCN